MQHPPSPTVVINESSRDRFSWMHLAGAALVTFGLCFSCILAGSLAWVVVARAPGQSVQDAAVKPFLSSSLSTVTQWEVACSASTPTDLRGDPFTLVESVYIANESATCIRVGGSDVTSSTGLSLGSGCRDGIGFAIDAKRAWCLSTSGTVTVDVVGGKQ